VRRDHAPFWVIMQIGMILGVFTTYPANAALARVGVQEALRAP